MTSLDDDGSTQHNAAALSAAEGPAESPAWPAQGPDSERLSPPADPWLTEAPTSVVADPATLKDFGAAPYGDPTHASPGDASPAYRSPTSGNPAHDGPTYGSPGYGNPPYDTDRRRDRRPRRLVLAVLAACAVFIAALLAVDRFRDDDSGDGALGTAPSTGAASPAARAFSTAASPKSSPAATAAGRAPSAPAGAERSPNAAGPQVVYEVTASGSGNTGSVAYTDQDGQIIRRNGIALPWRTTFPAGSRRQPLVLTAQRQGGGDTGPVTCTITVGGKVLSTTTAEGAYGAPQCSGNG